MNAQRKDPKLVTQSSE